jgi:hypothetical protein
VWLVVIYKTTDSLNQVLKGYGRIDVGDVRPVVVGLIAARVHEKAQIDVKYLKPSVRALRVLMTGFMGGRIPKSQLGVDPSERGILEWRNELRDYLAASEETGYTFRKKMLYPPVMALGLVTLRYKSVSASEFWLHVAKQDRLEQHTGPWHLAAFLREMELKQGVEDQRRTARRVASCWNAFIENRTVNHTSVGDVRKPARIEGTPYTTKQLIREVF